MSNEEELKKELLQLISEANDDTSGVLLKDKIDYGRLLELSSAISKFDQENVRFTVDAKIVERLGEQLVAKKTTALSELIKNAYDADASRVTVEFVDTGYPEGTIKITDNGQGMNFEELVSGFMTISTSDKVYNPTSNKYLRARAGKKGIGRFSAQKIGKKLKLITKKESADCYLCLNVDWNSFESGAYLNSISNRVSYETCYDFSEGTILEISDVREAWTESNIKTTYSYISSILNIPTKKKSDPGFSVHFKYFDSESNGQTTLFEVNEDTEFHDNADLKAIAKMDSNGQLVITIDGYSDERFTETIKTTEGFNDLLLKSDYVVELLYYSREKGSSDTRQLRQYLQNNGGIKLFRNGFNVAPYGTRSNDWLGLDDSYQKRTILPPHSNTNFIGKVSVTDPVGTLFEETSSREGLIENDAFTILTDTTYQIAIIIASHVGSIRNKKVTSSQKGFTSERQKREEKLKEQLEEMKKKLEAHRAAEEAARSAFDDDSSTHSNDGDESKSSEDEYSSAYGFNTEDFIEQLEKVEETLDEYIDEQLMYRVLSSTGLAISEFTHEIHMCLTNLNLNSQVLKSMSSTVPEVGIVSDQLEENLSMLNAYTEFFDSSMRSNSNREKNYYDIRTLVKKFVAAMEPTTKRRGYEFKTHFDSWGIWTKKVHISEIMSIFINLFTNACKAIDRQGEKNGKLLISVCKNTDHMTIRFEDNGDGIPKNKWAEVFAPLYTTAMPSKAFQSEDNYKRGMGLGLSITEEIITEMKGEIAVSEPSDGYRTCLKITLPTADESELPEDAY
ncbi:sensor histidine kinase [Vibrio sp. Y2-5]|uniref:sensor histidine kinase n=1 Tax=Vibrio sp. Y2-5 TaxID=2743977 RepID=UPI0016602A4F|nr:sensor histidine kinase [Vibrio sp. Y2-5]MBD0786380.1 sensor histidine kinase [Vibrio sp. Y2-5]